MHIRLSPPITNTYDEYPFIGFSFIENNKFLKPWWHQLLRERANFGTAGVAGEATSSSLAAMSAVTAGRVSVDGKGIGLLMVSFYILVVRWKRGEDALAPNLAWISLGLIWWTCGLDWREEVKPIMGPPKTKTPPTLKQPHTGPTYPQENLLVWVI